MSDMDSPSLHMKTKVAALGGRTLPRRKDQGVFQQLGSCLQPMNENVAYLKFTRSLHKLSKNGCEGS